MKLEKLSDNQIRCTLYKSDLMERELKLSELAYGTEKAKDLFRDMMQQASFEFGFEAEDIPLMIEAIPVSSECIVLVITKVDDPEELDTRFSKFSPSEEESQTNMSDEDEDIASLFSKIQELRDSIDLDNLEKVSGNDEPSTSDDFIPLTDSLKKESGKALDKNKSNKPKAEDATPCRKKVSRCFSFADLDSVSVACRQIKNASFESSLYKDADNSRYYLFMSSLEDDMKEFNICCNTLVEYGKKEKISNATEYFFIEHFEVIIKKDAVKIMSTL